MGWSISYELRRGEPLRDAERDALRAHVKKYARIKWEVEPYALQFPEQGDVVARGITKMPWKTSHRNWTSLLKALTELRSLVDGATCEVADDNDVVEWDAGKKKYTLGGGAPSDIDDLESDEWKPSKGARWFTLERIEKSDPHGNVFIDKKNEPRFEILDTNQEALVSMITDVRTAVATTIDRASLHLLDRDGQLLQTADIRYGSRIRLEPGVAEKIAMLELTARTLSPCTSRVVSRFQCAPITAAGAVALTEESTLELFPHVVTALSCEWVPDPPALLVGLDGRSPVMTPGHDLEIRVIACTETGMELERATVRGSFTSAHSLILEITPERAARVRRLEVRVDGVLVQEARVARWRLIAAG